MSYDLTKLSGAAEQIGKLLAKGIGGATTWGIKNPLAATTIAAGTYGAYSLLPALGASYRDLDMEMKRQLMQEQLSALKGIQENTIKKNAPHQSQQARQRQYKAPLY